MTKFGNLACEVARKAGLLLISKFGRTLKIGYKGVANLVTEMDLLSEKFIVSEIQKVYPDHNFLAEERTYPSQDSPYRWIIDPLDGTTNYAHGFPMFAVSIALEKDGAVIMGVVYDPWREEFFLAEKGKGARLNGRKIRVSSTLHLSQSLLSTGFPYDIRENPIKNFDHFTNFGLRAQAIRRTGSAALDLCYVASGRFDGFWEMKLGAWDLAAGGLIVREAGGKVTDFFGRPIRLDGKHLLATNRKIHRAMIQVLAMGRVP